MADGVTGAVASGYSAAGMRADYSQLLIEVARHRDRTAFAHLFDYYAPRLKTYFLRLGVAGGQAEDLAQETLLVVWRKADRFDPSLASASTWIFTIARNLRVDMLRREPRPAAAEAPAPVADDAPDAERVLISADAGHRLRDAVGELPEPQKRVVMLAYFEEKPHRAIERELGIPLGTVKTRIRRALLALRAAIGDAL